MVGLGHFTLVGSPIVSPFLVISPLLPSSLRRRRRGLQLPQLMIGATIRDPIEGMEGGDVLDPLDYLGVRYHYNGHFVKKDGIIDYNGHNGPRASSQPLSQPSHCVFNLAAFKAAKGPSSSQK